MSAQALAASVVAWVRAEMDRSSADCGQGTVTALAPGGVAGTVAVDIGSGAAITMRRSAAYTPTVADRVRWSRSRSGDWFCDYKLA
jgi:hypothetical protein